MYLTAAEFRKALRNYYDEIYMDEFEEVQDSDAEEDIAAACAEIDGSLSVRYTVPVTDTTLLPLARSWCRTIAADHAFMRPTSPEIPPKFAEAAKQVRDTLAGIASGKIPFGTAAENDAESVVLVDASEPKMTRPQMAGY
ncbi:MAG: phage protein Gp36 family protein [Lentisphaeria bacterium]|nr:phage protein Gp36 family protein [Lentisphaeria bacterium]